MPPSPLELSIEVTATSGARFQWDANQPATSRPQGFSFRTKLGEGFSDATLSLPRRVDGDYPDLGLLNDVTVTGGDGSIAYEGRISAMPRQLDETYSIGVNMTGYMANARDRQFTEIFVDRDTSAWGQPSLTRKVALTGANIVPHDMEQSTDPVSQTAAVTTLVEGAWTSPFAPYSEAWYDAGPNLKIGQVVFSWKRESSAIGIIAPWAWQAYLSSDDNATVTVASANLVGSGPGVGQSIVAGSGSYRYSFFQLRYGSTPAGADGARYAIVWYKPAVYGAHGVTLRTGDPGEPQGLYASDVIINIAQRFCPQLNTSGVEQTFYAIPHLVFKDLTDPYDAFLEVNKYHLWHLGVWDNRTLTYRPHNLEVATWDVRTDDPGTTFDWQGPSTDTLFNGIVVSYTDLLTGIGNILLPSSFPQLEDTADENPWNLAGIDRWDKIELSSPTLQSQALEIGRAALAERNRPKTPGQITLRGFVKDMSGIEQPVWKVRAGDTISLTNFPNDAPRLIHETDYNDDQKSVTLSIDGPPMTLDALFDRQSVALTAANLTR